MKIAILSKAGAESGGAGLMARSLRNWLDDDGHSVKMMTAEPNQGDQCVRGRATRLAKSLEVRTLMNEILPLDYPALRRAVDEFAPDVVHVHDISRAFSIDSISLLSRRYPTVWTLHDQSAITGGCITPHPCARFAVGCGTCPKHGTWSLQGRFDLTRFAFERRRRFHRGDTTILIAPSRWAAQRFESSAAFSGSSAAVRVIPNAIPPDRISHLTQDAARRKLGIPADRFVILLISHDLTDLVKNPISQRQALQAIADLNPLIVTMGNTSPEQERSFAPLDVRPLGFVPDPRIKRLAYTSANIFLNTSLADTFSMTTLEALAAGTPVVAYRSGGIPEILDESCGILVEFDSAGELARVTRRLITNGVPSHWSDQARQKARSFSPRRHLDMTVEIYTEAIESARGTR